jgi:hypothetical protein
VKVELIKVLNGSPTHIGSPFRIAWQSPKSSSLKTQFDIHLKIDKIGLTYIAYASFDGEIWHEVAQVPFYGRTLNPAIYASSNSDHPYVLVKFDYILIRKLQAE